MKSIKCIRRTNQETFCGREILLEWCFKDINHALETIEKENRYILCEKCLVKARSSKPEWHGD